MQVKSTQAMGESSKAPVSRFQRVQNARVIRLLLRQLHKYILQTGLLPAELP